MEVLDISRTPTGTQVIIQMREKGPASNEMITEGHAEWLRWKRAARSIQVNEDNIEGVFESADKQIVYRSVVQVQLSYRKEPEGNQDVLAAV